MINITMDSKELNLFSILRWNNITNNYTNLVDRSLFVRDNSKLWNLWLFAMTDVNLCFPILGLK